MNICSIHMSNSQIEYEGQYEFIDDYLEVEVYNYHASSSEYAHVGENVKYKEFTIVDLRNKVFIFSPAFYNVGVTFALTQYEKYRTNFYFKSGQIDSAEYSLDDIYIRKIILYNPILTQCYENPAFRVTYNMDEINYKVINNAEKNIVEIQESNIEKIEFGGRCTYSNLNNGQQVNIEAENYAVICLINPIKYEDLLMYINEFDIIMNAYCLNRMRSYSTLIITHEDKCFEVVHRLLGKERFCKNTIRRPIKMDFFEYMKTMYKSICYRRVEDKNKYILLDFKIPVSLEDQFIFYFRYIDLYMGQYIEQKTKQKPNNFDRLSLFVDENFQLFDSEDVTNIDNLKNELNSLRNQYIHEGYYLQNEQFAVKGKHREFLYNKRMDYNWLLRVVKALKYGVYKIFYTSVLKFEINEAELKAALKVWL